MKRHPTRYSINKLRIAQNGDAATISFFFGVDDLPNKSSWVSWAVLKRGEDGWAIEAAPTRALSGGTDPFSAFVTLLRAQEISEEPVALQNRGSQLLVVGNAFLRFVQNNGDRFPLQPFQLREKALPYYPALDAFLRPSSGQKSVSFNTKLAGRALSKSQKSQTVMLYEGANGKLDFGSDGRAAVVMVAGNVRFVDEKRAKMLHWSP